MALWIKSQILGINITAKAGKVLGVLIAVFVVFTVAGAIMLDVFQGVGDVNNVFANNASALNASGATDIVQELPILIAIAVVFGLLVLLLRASDMN